MKKLMEDWRHYVAEDDKTVQERIDENALIDLAVLRAAWNGLKVPGKIDDYLSSDGARGLNDKIDDWFKDNMGNPLVRLLYKSMMLMGSPGDDYRHDKKWERGDYDE